MAGLHYLGKPWQDNEEPVDREDDEAELPTHCQECGVELEEHEEVLCTECVDELESCPFDQDDHDTRFTDYYSTREGDIEPPY